MHLISPRKPARAVLVLLPAPQPRIPVPEPPRRPARTDVTQEVAIRGPGLHAACCHAPPVPRPCAEGRGPRCGLGGLICLGAERPAEVAVSAGSCSFPAQLARLPGLGASATSWSSASYSAVTAATHKTCPRAKYVSMCKMCPCVPVQSVSMCLYVHNVSLCRRAKVFGC